jgi:hypothetical protein
MSVTVELHIFSGRKNPSWELARGQIDELKGRLEEVRTRSILKPPGVLGGLGYTGFAISAVSESGLAAATYVHRGIIDTDRSAPTRETTGELEQWLLSTGSSLSTGLSKYVENEIKAVDHRDPMRGVTARHFAVTVPVYDNAKWNENPCTLGSNNCYNYAVDQITNSHPTIPGASVGKPVLFPYNCQELTDAAKLDGLRPVERSVVFGGTGPKIGHYVALVYTDYFSPEQDYDFHWYRKDKDGGWSHKPGTDRCKYTDHKEHFPIKDPEACDRGSYKYFCGYFHVVPGEVQVAGTNLVDLRKPPR